MRKLSAVILEAPVQRIHRPLSLVQLASVVLSLFIDVLVFTLTFARTIRHTIEMRQVGLGNCLSYFILRDGALCFLSKLLIGIVGTTIFSIPASESVETWINVVNSISNPLTIILITRLVLNLRQVSHVQEGNAPTLGTISTMQEPEFAINSFLQNIVASSRLGPDDDDGDGGHEIELISVDNEAEVVEEHGVVVNHSEIIELPCDPSDV
ncbi:hypothetical protein BD410DRAFT_450130 [Rickenella mellea]|uniref:Uncharacterized protein n=1 Tax=Rickenella mellea TaxID=50990 RepID=A0A4Y7PVN2_9AGAM|nr:hypothetical protein BD410DRAFT_450130 [Rickenella mellea]